MIQTNNADDLIANSSELCPNIFNEQQKQLLYKLEVAFNNHATSQPINPWQLSFNLLTAINNDQQEQPIRLAAIFLSLQTQLKKEHTNTITPEVRSILNQVSLIFSLESTLTSQNELSTKHQDQVRKMMLAIAGDTRAILLSMQYKLCFINLLKYGDQRYLLHEANIIQRLYAPIANILGMGNIKWQLEDASFRYLNPTAYYEIKEALNMRRADRDAYVEDIKLIIINIVKNLNIKEYQCSGRAKHIYSIYKKCRKKSIPYNKLYDSIAFRVLVPHVEDCYLILGEINKKYQMIPEEFDDYIAKPKPNGYQSIHTAIYGPSNHAIEIQIRTFDMHAQAESGQSAHWIYKEARTQKAPYEEKIARLRHLLDWQPNTVDTTHPAEQVQPTSIKDLFADRIYVFTPDETIIDLPAKATPLDFAYHIHSDVGHRTKGATINDQQKPLTTLLKNGDCVKIQTQKEPHPSHDWLNPLNGYLFTKRALQKASNWFRKRNRKNYLQKGIEVWDNHCRKKSIDKSIPDTVIKHFNFNSLETLYAALGSNDISVTAIAHQIQAEQPTQQKQDDIDAPLTDSSIKISSAEATQQKSNFIEIAGLNNIVTKTAKCCSPIPGDDIIGHITSRRGIVIHRKDCASVVKATIQKSKRLIAKWNQASSANFSARLTIIADNRTDLLHDITGACSQHKAKIKNLRLSPIKKSAMLYLINLDIQIENHTTLNKLISILSQIKNITSVSRYSL